MDFQSDPGGAHAVKYGVYRLQIAEMDVEGAERRDDHEIREDKGPNLRPMRPRIRYADMRRRCRPGWRAVPARIGRSRSPRASALWSTISALRQARAPFDRLAPPVRRTRAGRDVKNKQRPRGFGRAQALPQRSSQSPLQCR